MIPKEFDPDAPLQLVEGELVTWVPVKSTKCIENISQWSDLFDNYVAAYSSKHPDQTPNSMTHKFNNKRCGKPNCRFLHQCWMPGCGERHSVYKCPKLQNQSTKFSKPNTSSGAKQSSTANANKL